MGGFLAGAISTVLVLMALLFLYCVYLHVTEAFLEAAARQTRDIVQRELARHAELEKVQAIVDKAVNE